jgi:hypothetical protein
MPAFKNAPKQKRSKKPRKNAQKQNTQNTHRFLAIICLGLGAFV